MHVLLRVQYSCVVVLVFWLRQETLALRGLEEPLFVLLCNFFLAVNMFWFYILLMYLKYHKIAVFC